MRAEGLSRHQTAACVFVCERDRITLLYVIVLIEEISRVRYSWLCLGESGCLLHQFCTFMRPKKYFRIFLISIIFFLIFFDFEIFRY